MKNYLQADDTITVAAAPYQVASGGGLLVGNLFGVAKANAAQGAPVVIETEDCYALVKKAGDTFAVGDKAFWDDTNKVLTSTAAGNKWVGVVLAAAAAADAVVRVRLNGLAV